MNVTELLFIAEMRALNPGCKITLPVVLPKIGMDRDGFWKQFDKNFPREKLQWLLGKWVATKPDSILQMFAFGISIKDLVKVSQLPQVWVFMRDAQVASAMDYCREKKNPNTW